VRTLLAYKIGGLPVITENKLVGIITTTDILKAVVGFPAVAAEDPHRVEKSTALDRLAIHPEFARNPFGPFAPLLARTISCASPQASVPLPGPLRSAQKLLLQSFCGGEIHMTADRFL
jgi:hypothetical protein